MLACGAPLSLSSHRVGSADGEGWGRPRKAARTQPFLYTPGALTVELSFAGSQTAFNSNRLLKKEIKEKGKTRIFH